MGRTCVGFIGYSIAWEDLTLNFDKKILVMKKKADSFGDTRSTAKRYA